MSKRVGHLFPQCVDYDNLYRAWVKARQGTGWTEETWAFCVKLEYELLTLQDELAQGRYRPQPFRFFSIRDPKPRQISVAPFRDRVVHHALVQTLMPIFERSFIFDSYATRSGKGTHQAIQRAQDFVRRYPWYYKMDIARYFDSMNHDILLALIAKKVKDQALLDLTETVIRHPQFTHGLPIGNLTSQFFANVYLNPLDHWLKDELGIKGYLRYMDDFVLFSADKTDLCQRFLQIKAFLEQNLNLQLKVKACWLNRSSQGLSFLGWRIFPAMIRHCPANRQRSLKKMQARLAAYEKGWIDEQSMADSLRCIWSHCHYFA